MDKSMKFFSVVIVLLINFFIGVSIYQLTNAQGEEPSALVNGISDLASDKISHIGGGSDADSAFSFGQKEPFAVLLLGVDTENLKGRSDAIIVSIVNPETSEVTLMSIPRDTRVDVEGEMDKITHAHAYGGVPLAVETVEKALDIPVKYYVKVNLDGFTEMVDAIGGVEMNVTAPISFKDRLTGNQFNLSPGVQTLTGYEALGYARFRGDAQGDFGRNDRQKEVIKAVIDQSMDVRNLKSVLKIIGIMGENIETDLTKKDILQLLVSMKGINGEKVNTLKVDAKPQYIAPVSYVVIEDAEMDRVQRVLDELLSGKNLQEAEAAANGTP